MGIFTSSTHTHTTSAQVEHMQSLRGKIDHLLKSVKEAGSVFYGFF